MERLSLFRPVSNAAVSGFLSHTASDQAETLLVGWAEGKEVLFLLMWYFAIRSAALLRLLHQWLPSGIMALQSMSGSSKLLPAGKGEFQEKGEKITYLAVLPMGAVENPAACGAQGKRISRENLWSKVLVGGAEQVPCHLWTGHSFSTSYLLLPFDYFCDLLFNL